MLKPPVARLARLLSFVSVLVLPAACSRTFELTVDPPEAELLVDGRPAAVGQRLTAGADPVRVIARAPGHEEFSREFEIQNSFGPQKIDIDLELKKYEVTIDVTAGRAACAVDGEDRGETPLTLTLPHGPHRLVLKAAGFPDLEAILEARRPGTCRYRLQPGADSPGARGLRPLGVFDCGSQPKQAIFSPDDRFIYFPLLDDEGFQIFDLATLSLRPLVKAGPKPGRKAFPEGLFIEKYASFFVSQMSTNSIHEFMYADDGTVVPRRSLKTGGVFPKFLAWCAPRDLVAVSNWITDDVVLIDYKTGGIVKRLTGLATPRGLEFSADGKTLYIASYDGGHVYRYATDTWTETHRFTRAGSCMRHIVLAPDGKRLFVSDMSRSVVYEFDAADLSLRHAYKASWNTNTIGLDGRGRYLFVSNRGPNNKVNYTLRSPEDGKVLVFDTEKRELVATIQGGNQPTGLDVSHDDRYLVFTNFLDRTFELYDVSRLTNAE